MRKFILAIVVLVGFVSQSYALSGAVVEKIAEVLEAKINADKEVAIAAIKQSPTITIDGEVFNKVTIGEDVVLVGNAGIFLLGSIDVGSITNIVELRKNSVVIGNVGVTAGN